ncbi:hypothetical protein SLEP1_g32953 [Rubroshorea leprosula]|uniref:Uncharacterized protein n=2 Tax=Rubroshorea leprosula TaxID=152421 RepID=A0AAV5KF16_9ROSI|nr:hypothetical protein SLEP1_g32953 [Rubroshorea leprosula]
MMDAVGFNYPVDVSKLRVTKDSDPVVTTSIQSCSNSHRHKDGTSSVNGLEESALQDKIADAELSRHAVQQSCCQGEELSEQHDSKGTGCHSAPGAEFVSVHRKARRVSRCSNGSSKRSRVAPPDDIVNSAGVDDVKSVTDKSGSSPTKCNPPEKIQPAKQRHNFGGKRGERRNCKMSMKPKYEIFSLKSGFLSFGSGVGGNNFFGAYGLKPDVQDITKLVDDVSLNELLDGTYECTSFGKDKGKKAQVMNGNFLDSVRKAWSVVPPQKPVQHQNISEIDSFPSKKFPTYPSSPVTLAARVVNGEKEDCCPADLSSSNKILDSCGKPEMRAALLDFPLCQPKDVLEHLMLPPPKDLESLLLDAAKPSSSSRNTSDLRSGKQISRRPSLPPFPWSHTSNGHCRTNSDVVKCLTSRTTCQGRWVKIAKAASSPGSGTYSSTDLESLTYDQSMVPLRSKSGGLDNRIFPSTSGLPFGEWGSPSLATDSRASQVPIESGSELKDQVNDARCPRLLAAAQTLCDIATNPLRKNLNGFLRWLKKTPQKTMKARKSRLIEKSEEKYSTYSVSGSVKLVRSDVEHIMPSKRPKLSTAENKKGLGHTTCVRKGTMPSPTPKSSRSSPGKSVRESILEARHSPATVVKQPC